MKREINGSKKVFPMIMAMIMMCVLAFGTLSVQAASLKDTASAKIASTVKNQYGKVTANAKKWNYTIVRDKKEGRLKKVDENTYSQAWNIRLKNKKSKAFLIIVFENTYSGETEKVASQISLNVTAGKLKGKKIGKGDTFNKLSSLTKVMKQLKSTNGFGTYGVQASGKAEDAEAACIYKYHYMWTTQCSYCSKTYAGAWLHRLFCSLCSGKKLVSNNNASAARSWGKSFWW